MLNKELQMDRFEADNRLPEQENEAGAEQAAPSLESLLNKQTMSGESGPDLSDGTNYGQADATDDGADQSWQKQDIQQEYDNIRSQAVAQEKMGYEDDTKKFFMDDPDNMYREPLGEEEQKRVFGTKESSQSLESLNGPPLVFGGFILGASVTVMGLAYFGMLEVADTMKLYIFGGIAAAVGFMYAAQLRN